MLQGKQFERAIRPHDLLATVVESTILRQISGSKTRYSKQVREGRCNRGAGYVKEYNFRYCNQHGKDLEEKKSSQVISVNKTWIQPYFRQGWVTRVVPLVATPENLP